jgi:hypothetical protein
MTESFRRRSPLVALLVLAIALPAASVNTRTSIAPRMTPIGAPDSGAQLATVGRYQLRLDEARNLLGT